MKRKEDKDKNDEEEKRLKLFESLNDTQKIFSFEIVNSELENGFSSENDLEHSLQVNGFSPEWMLGEFWDFLIPKMTWNILYKGGEGDFFWKWLHPENGFSWDITSPQEIKKYHILI